MLKRAKRVCLLTVGVVVLAGFSTPELSSFDSVRLKYFNVVEEGKTFVLSWESAEEDAILSYELERKTTFSNNEFLLLKGIDAKGANVRYLHRDDQIFKSGGDVVDYRLMAIYSSGAREILVTKSVNYTPTALRRTWGSIKAMF